MKVFITLERSALRIEVQSTDAKDMQQLTNVVHDLRGRLLSGRFATHVEEERGISSATLILIPMESNLALPVVVKQSNGLLH